jgi:hypothetical protein
MEVSPGEIVEGLNRFVIPIFSTFKRAVAGDVFVNPSWVCNALDGIVLL